GVEGAVIGAVIGAGGAGTVILEGRDQLDLPRGTELTIISSTPRGPAEATGAQRKQIAGTLTKMINQHIIPRHKLT
ncbi:MAG TPA: hypothetical protein VH702_18735, partial [Vicinamibacterales bacterium]